MREVVIQIPTLETEQNVEIDVRINGRKQTIRYRVEIVDWESENPDSLEKVKLIRRVISENIENWELIQVGAPRKDSIPVLFRKRGEKAMAEIQ